MGVVSQPAGQTDVRHRLKAPAASQSVHRGEGQKQRQKRKAEGLQGKKAKGVNSKV